MPECFFAALLAAFLRSSLYGAVRRKEKRPFAISNSMQPVSGVCVSLTALVGVLLGISGKPLFEVGVVGADKGDRKKSLPPLF